MSTVKVSELTIRFPDGTTKQMGVEEARALLYELASLFGATLNLIPPVTVVREVEVVRERWPHWYEPCKPIWINTPSTTDTPLPKLPQVWRCSGDVAG